MQLSGLHHITAICGDAQSNVNFYSKLLGLRLVKVTINFDDPGTYHLYYGDSVGSPGSALTFFAWPNLPRGKAGSSQASLISFSVPPISISWWKKRLTAGGVAMFDEGSSPNCLRFIDPDGINLELVETSDEREAWTSGGVGIKNAIRGFDSVMLSVGRADASKSLLESMGFQSHLGSGTDVEVMALLDGRAGQKVKLFSTSERGSPGVGTIHHVAFATESDESQRECAAELTGLGLQPTSVQERQYFRSVYYRESSGVLYEIATAGPGFLIDEPLERLGTRLCIPPWYEKFRPQIEESLPKIVTPSGVQIPS